MIGQSWFTAKWYNTSLLKTQRVADCFPNEPRVWEKLGWCHYQAGDYDKAIECAQQELRFDNPNVQSGAYQLMGLSQLKQGHGGEALRLLHDALQVDPHNDLGLYRLATAYEDLGRLDEALPFYEAAAKAAPLHNPTLHRLAGVYRRLARTSDARATYEKQLVNNPYEVPAVLALSELDIALGTRDAFLAAERRLLNLLQDLPDDARLRINLGVVRYHLGRIDEAIDAYRQVLRRDHNHVTAALNLAQLALTGDVNRVRAVAPALSGAAAAVPMANAALAYAALAEGRFDEAVSRVTALCRIDDPGAEARRLLLTALERFDQERPNVPWTFGLTAELLLTDGQLDAARAFTDLFETRCDKPACRDYIRLLRQRLSSASSFAPNPSTGTP
jgi:tetratricopeptide (TPR) repeat protein